MLFLIKTLLRGISHILKKEDIISINGFDENYLHPSIGEDDDINWCLSANGVEGFPCRYFKNN